MYLWAFLSVVLFGSGLVVLGARRNHPLGFVAAIFTTIFIRVVVNLPPTMKWGMDNYEYFSLTSSVFKTQHLAPTQETLTLFPHAPRRILFGALHILTVSFGGVAGLADSESLRLFFPIIFALLYLGGALIIARRFLPSELALPAAFVFSNLDTSIVNSSRYIQYGLAVGVMLFLIATVITWEGNDKRKYVLIILFTIAASLSHSFMFAIAGLALSSTWLAWKSMSYIFETKRTARDFRFPLTMFSILLGFFILSGGPLIEIALQSMSAAVSSLSAESSAVSQQSPEPTTQAVLEGFGITSIQHGSGHSLIDSFSLIIKGILSCLAVPAILYTRHSTNRIHYLVALGFGINALVLPLIILRPSTGGRFVAFGYLPLVTLAFLSIHLLTERGVLSDVASQVATPSLVVLFVLMGVVAGPSMSLVDPSTDLSADGFHNVEPIGEQGPHAGRWLKSHYPNSRSAAPLVPTNRHQAPVVFYYGPTEKAQSPDRISAGESSIFLVDLERSRVDRGGDELYDNGRLILYKD